MQEIVRFALLGLGLGALYALASQGLILIYRGSGVLNLAHGAIGMAGSYLFYALRVEHGVSFGLALTAGIAASAVIGALTHILVMRPLRRASPLARIVATLAVLIAIQSIVTVIYGNETRLVPSDLSLHLVHFGGSVVLSADRLILAGIAAVLAAALYVIYRYTKFGIGTTAVAENPRAAAAIGWSPDVIATVNWALGSALAGLAGILITPIVELQVGTMTNLVLAAMAAALVANFRSFPVAFAAGMLLGIGQTELTRYWAQPGGADSLPFMVVIAVVVFTGRALPLRDFFLQRLPAVGSGRIRWSLALPGIAIAAVLIVATPDTWSFSLGTTFATAIILLSLVVLTGYAGQLSLAQFALAGVGAFAAGRLADVEGLGFWPALVIGVIAAMPVGAVFALPAIRTRGVNLAIVTYGLGSAIELIVFDNQGWTGGYTGTTVGSPSIFGLSLDPVQHTARYSLFALAWFVVMVLVVANLRRGRTGHRMLAVRTNERAAAALGVDVRATKLYAFTVASAVAAVGGILLAYQIGAIDYTSFTTFTSISFVGYAFLGGIGFLAGPLVGATLAPNSVGVQIGSSLFGAGANWVAVVGGVGTIAIILRNQDGMVREAAAQWRSIGRRLGRLVPRRMRDRWASKPAALSLLDPSMAWRKVPAKTLRVADLTVRYGAVTALDQLSLTLIPGRVTGLIGPNGAGKTTAIDAITGFTSAASGTSTLDDVDVTAWNATRRAHAGLSRSFQSLELFEDLTVLDNLRVASDPGSWRSYVTDLIWPKLPALSREVLLVIREFGLEEQLDRRVEDLPYGLRRLVAIARAVASGPSVLLLDEPAAGLSETESLELAHLVRRVADQAGMAVLIVEHDMNFVMTICDEIVVLDFGRTIGRGTPADIRDNDAVVAAYLGEIEENMAVESGEGDLREPEWTASPSEAAK